MLSKDVKRLLKHKQTNLVKDEEANESNRRDRRFLKSRLDAITSVAALQSLAAELLIAQQISAALPPKPARIQHEEVVV